MHLYSAVSTERSDSCLLDVLSYNDRLLTIAGQAASHTLTKHGSDVGKPRHSCQNWKIHTRTFAYAGSDLKAAVLETAQKGQHLKQLLRQSEYLSECVDHGRSIK